MNIHTYFLNNPNKKRAEKMFRDIYKKIIFLNQLYDSNNTNKKTSKMGERE